MVFSMLKMMNKRWYDADPVIKNAINIIQNSDDEKKNMMADFIIKEAKNLGVEPDRNIGENNFDCFWHRRQDENAKYFIALEYLKAMEDEAKREISFKIIAAFKNTAEK